MPAATASPCWFSAQTSYTLRTTAPSSIASLRRPLAVSVSPHKMGAAYEWYRRLGFRETTKLNFAEVDDVVAMELPLG